MVRTNETVAREVFRIYATEEEKECGLNATRIQNGIFRVVCVDIAADNMTDLAELHRILIRGWYEPDDSQESYFKLFVVLLDLGQFTYRQLRNGELMVSDIVSAEWFQVYEIQEVQLKEGDWL